MADEGGSIKILVTGAGGFLGRRVLGMLTQRGYRVLAMTRRPDPDLCGQLVENVVGDLSNPGDCRRAVRGARAVIHCAAKSGVWGPLKDYIAANYEATVNIFQAAAGEAGLNFFVHVSSPSVVHSGRPLDGADESAPYMNNKAFAYPYSKMLAEKFILGANSPALKTVALRPHLIWGPGDPHFLPRLKKRAAQGRLYILKTSAKVDATYIDNAAWALVLALEKLMAGQPVDGRAYFIGQGEPVTVAELLGRILAALDLPPVKMQLPPQAGAMLAKLMETVWRLFNIKGEPPLTSFVVEELSLPHWFDLSRARGELGYSALVSTEEGLKRLAASRQREFDNSSHT